MITKRYGLNLHRLESNLLEKKFSDVWNNRVFKTTPSYGEQISKYIYCHQIINQLW